MSYRSDVVDQIAPLLPDEWTILPYSDEPDVLDRPTVMVTATDIDPSRLASQYDVTMHVYVLIPNHDDVLVDSDEVDDAVLLSLDAILRLKAVTQGNATRATFQGGSPCWDITITITAPVIYEEE
jgi:hypothetical protein